MNQAPSLIKSSSSIRAILFVSQKMTKVIQKLYETTAIRYLRTMGEYSMKDAMRQFLNQSKLKGDIQAMQIEEVWENLMGKTISKYTDSIKIIHHTLIITTTVAPLKQELLFQKENIIKRVNEVLGEGVVREVMIK